MNHVTGKELGDLARAVRTLNRVLGDLKWGNFTVTGVTLTFANEANEHYFDVRLPEFDDGFNVALVDPEELS